MNQFYSVLERIVTDHQPNFGDGDSVLTLLYDAYSKRNRIDHTQIITEHHSLRI